MDLGCESSVVFKMCFILFYRFESGWSDVALNVMVLIIDVRPMY